jgi:MYXO-CTERM domain-containing protein
MNGGWETLTGSTVTATSTDTNLTFDNGGVATVASLEPYGTAEVSIGVTAKPTTPQRTLAAITFTLANANAVKASVPAQVSALVNYDDKAGVSSSDDVESNRTPPAWTAEHNKIMIPALAWARDGDAKNHFWHGTDTGAPSDELLTSPSLNVSATTPFVMNFSHRYSFEADVAGAIYYDGGIIEISEDNGMTWKDVSSYPGIDPGYTQKLYSTVPPPPPDAAPTDAASPDANPLAGRLAFASESPGYPNSWLTTSLDFGMAFAGKTVKVRFRIGTDEGTGAPGWDIDNISFGGPQFSSLTNTPFGGIAANAGMCSDGGTDGGRPDAAADVRTDTGTTDVRTSDTTADAPRTDSPTSDAPPADVPAPTVDAPRDMGTTPPTTTTGGGGGTSDDGCGCVVAGGRSSSSKGGAALALLGALSMVLRRRRRITH